LSANARGFPAARASTRSTRDTRLGPPAHHDLELRNLQLGGVVTFFWRRHGFEERERVFGAAMP
jgi:hypothetical protein